MKHIMKLNAAPFEMIRSGRKTIELRLYDEKRRRVSVGDEIEFVSSENPALSLHFRVTALHRFSSFEELYRSLPLLSCGYTEENLSTASPEDMDTYYSREEQERWGVLGIEIQACD